ncbi:MBL fold metallo-hydrolase [Pandoraea sp.]|uniref:MBL fold metallo-hydrolase n=1 Tax=Pandoraea sp. TaxID=1883445 RepID=UPI0025DF0C54|nr:MBL fold metallo-hydrolase [Pandoraea sp.]
MSSAELPPRTGAPRDARDGRFRNRQRIARSGSFWRWQWDRWRARHAGAGRGAVPDLPVADALPQVWRPGPEPVVTWVGHATVLVQAGGLNVLTDPIFSERASPLPFLGPRRLVPAAPGLDRLPRIDAVLLSHNHYDHLDLPTLRALARQGGGAPTFFAPLGLHDWLLRRGIGPVIGLDWWQHARLGAARMHLVPAQHWSRRSLRDINRTLWGGWVAEWADFRFLFTGDTAYCDEFKAIGEHFGGIDLAAIPIGAYEPRWFMRAQHVNPDEAVRILQDTRSRQGLAIHWGTFHLTDEPLDEPPRKLLEALRARQLPTSRFWILQHGETRLVRP